MKKLSLYIFLVLIWCNVGFAKPVLLECLDDEPVYPDKEEVFTYLSLDLDKKDFEVVAVKTVLKDDCALGNCEGIEKYNRKLHFISENQEFLKIGEEGRNYLTINKKTLGEVWYSYYFVEGNDGKQYKEDDYGYLSCKKINKFTFK